MKKNKTSASRQRKGMRKIQVRHAGKTAPAGRPPTLDTTPKSPFKNTGASGNLREASARPWQLDRHVKRRPVTR